MKVIPVDSQQTKADCGRLRSELDNVVKICNLDGSSNKLT